MKMIRVRAVGEGEAARSVPRVDEAGGLAVRNGARFVGRDPAGAPLPGGELVPDVHYYRDHLAQGHLEPAGDDPPAAAEAEPAPAPAARRAR